MVSTSSQMSPTMFKRREQTKMIFIWSAVTVTSRRESESKEGSWQTPHRTLVAEMTYHRFQRIAFLSASRKLCHAHAH